MLSEMLLLVLSALDIRRGGVKRKECVFSAKVLMCVPRLLVLCLKNGGQETRSGNRKMEENRCIVLLFCTLLYLHTRYTNVHKRKEQER